MIHGNIVFRLKLSWLAEEIVAGALDWKEAKHRRTPTRK
jgi:hypothetical protein